MHNRDIESIYHTLTGQIQEDTAFRGWKIFQIVLSLQSLSGLWRSPGTRLRFDRSPQKLAKYIVGATIGRPQK